MKLRYDGLYISNAGYFSFGNLRYDCLRFYEDGLVLSATFDENATPHEVSKWFHRDNPNQYKGSFDISGRRQDGIHCRFERAHYLGEIKDDRLILKLYTSDEWYRKDDIEEFIFVAF